MKNVTNRFAPRVCQSGEPYRPGRGNARSLVPSDILLKFLNFLMFGLFLDVSNSDPQGQEIS